MSDIIRHLTICGRVQGVGYRAFVEEGARQRGLAGWVRNRRDASVEAVISGPEDKVADLIKACRRGPVGAWVDKIDERQGTPVDEAEARAVRGSFLVLPTV